MRIARRGDWLSASIGDEVVMMSAESGAYLGLSEVGAWIWGLLETPQEFEAVCGSVLAEFDVEPEICRSEVEAFLRDLADRQVLTLEPSAAV